MAQADFAFLALFAEPPCSAFCLAQRFRCASAILALASADILGRFLAFAAATGTALATFSALPTTALPPEAMLSAMERRSDTSWSRWCMMRSVDVPLSLPRKHSWVYCSGNMGPA